MLPSNIHANALMKFPLESDTDRYITGNGHRSFIDPVIYTCAKTDKLRSFGYDRPTTSLEDSVKDCICNYFAPDKHLGDE